MSVTCGIQARLRSFAAPGGALSHFPNDIVGTQIGVANLRQHCDMYNKILLAVSLALSLSLSLYFLILCSPLYFPSAVSNAVLRISSLCGFWPWDGVHLLSSLACVIFDSPTQTQDQRHRHQQLSMHACFHGSMFS